METNSGKFARRIFETLTEEGMTAEKARIVRDEIMKTAEAKGWPKVSENVKACVSRFSKDMQSVYVDDEGYAMLHTGIAREHQPLINIVDFGPPRVRTKTKISHTRRAA